MIEAVVEGDEEDLVIAEVAVVDEEDLEVVIEVGEVVDEAALEEVEEVHPGEEVEEHQVVVAVEEELQEAEAPLEVVDEEELEEVAMSLSSLTDILVSLLRKERNIYSSPRIWYLVKQFMEKRELASKVRLKKQMELPKRQNTEFGILSDPSWLLVYWVVWITFISNQVKKSCTWEQQAVPVLVTLLMW